VDLVLNAGLVVKLVLLVLVYFSVVSWAIIIWKFKTVNKAMRQSHSFLEFFWQKKRFSQIAPEIKSFDGSPLAALFREGYQELMRHKHSENSDMGDIGSSGSVKRVLRRASTLEIQRLEKHLQFLATTGSTAPFIGLFGTVWGIMDAFRGIGQTGSASLAVVAPGISEALVATAIGLIAAIPAVIGYNNYLNKINILIGEMDSFSLEFLNIVERTARRD